MGSYTKKLTVPYDFVLIYMYLIQINSKNAP